MRGVPALLAVVVASCASLCHAVPITINPSTCVTDHPSQKWDVMRVGPLIVCRGGTVTLRWTGMHGVFQIPSIACPSNFTGAEGDAYKFLASASNGGEFVWKTPNETGHYWLTSQYANDCRSGMIGEIYVVSPEDEPFMAAALRANVRVTAIGAAVAAILALLVA